MIAVMLVLIAGVLLLGHDATTGAALVTGPAQIIAGVVFGFGIGVVASLLGVAGGELLIPTLVLLFGADIKLAGSLSLAVSLPTMIVGFTRYSWDESFSPSSAEPGIPADDGRRCRSSVRSSAVSSSVLYPRWFCCLF